MNIPIIDHPTKQPNLYTVKTDKGLFWYSYKTCIAFNAGGDFVIRENDWNQTTGRHLNHINPDKSIRISGLEFERKLAELN